MYKTEENANGTKLYTFNDKRPKLKELQDLVGGYIQVIHCMGFDLVVDEEGLLKKDNFHNKLATALYHTIPIHGGVIVGDVVKLEGKAKY